MGGKFHNGTYNVREFKRLLHNNGFEFHRQAGNHRIYKRGSETLSLPTHNLKMTVAYDLIKQYNLKED